MTSLNDNAIVFNLDLDLINYIIRCLCTISTNFSVFFCVSKTCNETVKSFLLFHNNAGEKQYKNPPTTHFCDLATEHRKFLQTYSSCNKCGLNGLLKKIKSPFCKYVCIEGCDCHCQNPSCEFFNKIIKPSSFTEKCIGCKWSLVTEEYWTSFEAFQMNSFRMDPDDTRRMIQKMKETMEGLISIGCNPIRTYDIQCEIEKLEMCLRLPCF